MSSKKKIIAITLIFLFIILFIVVPYYIAYSSLHPSRCGYHKSPDDYGLSYTNFTVTTKDGISLKGWIIDPKGEEKNPIIIIMHGYTSCKASNLILSVSRDLAQRGYRIVLFDFRAHGESGGDMTTIGPLEAKYDAKAVIDYISRGYPNRSIVLMGYSMGAVVAIMEGNNDTRVSAIIADSPYPLLNEVVPRWLKAKMGIPTWYSHIIGFFGEKIAGIDTNYGPMKLYKINKPLLVIVGTKDPLLREDEANKLAAKSCCGRALIVNGAGHVDSYDVLNGKYIEEITRFIDEYAIQTSSSASAAAPPNPWQMLAMPLLPP